MIQEPTYFTEHSSSFIDILIVSNKRHVIHCGVSDPFLHQDTRYHCPIYGILNQSEKLLNVEFGSMSMVITIFLDKKQQKLIGIP